MGHPVIHLMKNRPTILRVQNQMIRWHLNMASLKQVGFGTRVSTCQRFSVSTQRVDLTDGGEKGDT